MMTVLMVRWWTTHVSFVVIILRCVLCIVFQSYVVTNAFSYSCIDLPVLHMWMCKRFTSDYGSRLCEMDAGQETWPVSWCTIEPKLLDCYSGKYQTKTCRIFFEVDECDIFTWIGYVPVPKLTNMGNQKLWFWTVLVEKFVLLKLKTFNLGYKIQEWR